MKIIVVGGGGFLGRRIVELGLERGHSVSVFDLKKTFEDDRIDAYFTGNLTNLTDLITSFAGMDAIIHTASPPHGCDPQIYHAVNVQGTVNVIAAAKKARVKKLIFTSSASVIYNGEDLISADESTPYCDVHMDAYNESKALAEVAVIEANDPNRLLTVALRPSGIFGPRDSQGSLAMVQAAKRGQWRVMIGSNDNLFDMTFVDNAAYAHLLAAEKLEQGNGIAGQVFIITNDEPMFFWDFPKALFDGLGYKETMKIVIPKWLGMILGRMSDMLTVALSPIKEIHPSFTSFRVKLITANRYFNISKAKTLLGYSPIVPMNEAMKRTVEYWESGYSIRN